MKSIGLIILLSISSTLLSAQAVIQFDKDTHNFGEILEENGPVNFKFEYTNMGTAPLIINNVKASCGCTTPGWTKEPVMPGKRGYIEAQYNPLNRPGSFRKSLTIYSNNSEGNKVIYIQGNVTPKPRSLAETLPTKIGNLKIRTRTFNVGNVTNNRQITKTFDVYNDGDAAISLVKVEAPEHINISFNPAAIEPKGSGKIIVKYDAVKRGELGYVRDDLKLYTNEAEMEVKKLSTIATIREYFPPMSSEQAAKAPKLKFEKTIIEFGSVKQGEPVSADFSFTNLGKTALNIRQIKTNCNCTKSSMENENIAPGATGKISVIFNTDGRKGVQHQQITVFSNDPKGSMQMLALRGTVNSK